MSEEEYNSHSDGDSPYEQDHWEIRDFTFYGKLPYAQEPLLFRNVSFHIKKAVVNIGYKDYREPPWSENKYEIAKDFWAVLAARLAFVIVFQNLVMFMSDFVDWIIPDIPKDISQQIHKEKVLMVEVFMKEEQGKLQLLETWRDKDKRKGENCNSHSPRSSMSHRGSVSSCHSCHVDV